MTFTYWKVERYPKTDTSWSSTAIDIPDFYEPRITISYGEGKDTFEFKLQNFNGEWDNVWSVGDKVYVYYKANSSSLDSSDLRMIGVVTDLPNEHDGTKNFIRVVCRNFSETLMNALVFYDPSATGDTVPQYIEQALNSVGNFNQKFKVGWASTNPSVKRDGVTAFPTIYEPWFYKTALKLLEQYSQDSYTQDGNYYWYINTDNELVWLPRTDAVDYVFNSNSDIYKAMKIKKDTSKVVNFIIAKGGLDPKGNSITAYVPEPVSMGKHGFKFKLITLSATDENNLLQLDNSAAGVTSGEPITPSNYPSTTGWVATVTDYTGSPTITAGSRVNCSSWNEYVDAFRAEIKYRLKNQAKDYLAEYKYGKLMLDIEFSAGKGWDVGNIISVTIPEIGAENNKMRVKKIDFTPDGEVYTLEEDEGTV